MTDNDLNTIARCLHEAIPTPKPDWDQIGETTRSYWRDRAASSDVAKAAASSSTEAEPQDNQQLAQASLF